MKDIKTTVRTFAAKWFDQKIEDIHENNIKWDSLRQVAKSRWVVDYVDNDGTDYSVFFLSFDNGNVWFDENLCQDSEVLASQHMYL
jgi:hypothetical protein